jgi:enediyne biosynthesis protein E4
MESVKPAISSHLISHILRFTLLFCVGVASADVTFVDVTDEAGIAFHHTNGANGRRYTVETMGSGGAFFDFDSDGDLDIYLVNGAALSRSKGSVDTVALNSETPPTNKLFANNGDGTFIDVTGRAGVGDTGYGMGCAIGDIDNDGAPDLYVTNFGANVLYRNNGDGTFTDVTVAAGVGEERWSSSAAFFDYDLDGYLDLFVLNYLDYTLEKNRIWLGKAGLPIYCGPSYYFAERDTLYHNNGDGTFTDVTQEMNLYRLTKGLGVICGDINEDGFPDIYIANDTRANRLYLNQAGEWFQEVGRQMGVAHNRLGHDEAGMGVDLGDYDRDGLLDLFVTNFTGETNTLYRNLGEDGFIDATETANLAEASWLSLGFGTKFIDVNNDGFLDLFVANGHIDDLIELSDEEVTYAQTDQLFVNAGDGRFTDVSADSGAYFSTRKVGRGAAFGDYDNDGDTDILINNNGQSPALLRNDGGNRKNWLKVKLIGTASNRDGVGVKVKVVVGDRIQLEELRSGGSYLSDHDRRLHFGLGDAPSADVVEIHWHNRPVERIEAVPANRLLIVTEGAGHRVVGLR